MCLASDSDAAYDTNRQRQSKEPPQLIRVHTLRKMPSPKAHASETTPGRRRWVAGFPLGVLLLTVPLLAWVARFGRSPGFQNLFGFAVIGGACILLGVWFACYSRFAPWMRRWGVLLLVSMIVILASLFRIQGYTGDMVPKLVFRWSGQPDRRLSAPVSLGQLTTSVGEHREAVAAECNYPQFLGPERHPRVSDLELAHHWDEQAPECLWRQPIGAGWSAFAVVGDRAVTQEQRGDQEMVICYSLGTGEVLWARADELRFTSHLGGDGPRATPTLHNGKVYSHGATGVVHCLDLATGSLQWSHDTLAEHGAENLAWGKSGSPLIIDELVAISVGGPHGQSLVAYHQDTGEQVWSVGNDRSSYSSPALAIWGEMRQIVVVNEDWVVGHRPSDGQELWRHAWPGKSNSNASTSQPVPVDARRLFLSRGYGGGCALIEVLSDTQNGMTTKELWRRPQSLKTKLTNVVIRDGFVYGLSEGILECVELETGQRQWKRGRYGHGQLIAVGETLLVTGETGMVALVDATPEKYHEWTRFQAIEGKTWNNPALAGPYLLIRNHREAACYRLPLAAETSSRR